MNRKFVKENKTLVKEFLSDLITKVLTGKSHRDIQKRLNSDPKIQQHKANIKRIEQQIIDKVDNIRKNDPDFDKRLKRLQLKYKS
jgi:uncharacterized protein YaaR (DUF327 family)|tara:strand:+ start:203 stop:457 length:255 start_codon:yes stop_codon:yes gene_type:complete